jgi:hypothetical protein
VFLLTSRTLEHKSLFLQRWPVSDSDGGGTKPTTPPGRISSDGWFLGLTGRQRVCGPGAIQDFQPARDLKPTDPIEIEPRRGWLICLDESST